LFKPAHSTKRRCNRTTRAAADADADDAAKGRSVSSGSRGGRAQKLTEFGNEQQPDVLNESDGQCDAAEYERQFADRGQRSAAQMQSRLYQQAAQGRSTKATRIARRKSPAITSTSRRAIDHAGVDFKRAAINPTPEKLAEIRQKLAALPSIQTRAVPDRTVFDDSEGQSKLALRFMDDARTLVSRKATSYTGLENQIKVADAYAALDAKKSFEVLEPGIAPQRIVAAAEVLNGFEVEVFKDGELSLRGDSDLVGMIARYGQELASLAKL